MWQTLNLWIAEHTFLISAVAIASVLIFFLGLAAVPWVLVRLPKDHFIRPEIAVLPPRGSGVLAWGWMLFRNLLGVVLLIAGFIMLFVPGPGIVSMVLGLSLVQFPGRRKLEAFLIHRPFVHKNINKLRTKYNVPPLDLPQR